MAELHGACAAQLLQPVPASPGSFPPRAQTLPAEGRVGSRVVWVGQRGAQSWEGRGACTGFEITGGLA